MRVQRIQKPGRGSAPGRVEPGRRRCQERRTRPLTVKMRDDA
jgi:hypothetical protein